MSSTSSSLQVALRVKPPVEKVPTSSVETGTTTLQSVNVLSTSTIQHKSIDSERTYTFDKVYSGTSAEASQAVLFHDIGKRIVRDVLDAVNVCVMAYGQSGTGKQYTLLGSSNTEDHREEHQGLVPRIVVGLYDALQESATQQLHGNVAKSSTTRGVVDSFFASAVYMVNEKVYDALPSMQKSSKGLQRKDSVVAEGMLRRTRSSSLLHTGSGSSLVASPAKIQAQLKKDELRVREHPTSGPYIEGIQEVQAHSSQELIRLYNEVTVGRPQPKGVHIVFMIRYLQLIQVVDPTITTTTSSSANNETGKTSKPPLSVGSPVKSLPRRHSVVSDLVNPTNNNNTSDLLETNQSFSRRSATLTICDLASVDRSAYEYKIVHPTAEERQAVGKLNQSLSSLSRIIALLGEKAKKGVLPYRDSTLTWILKDKLSGNCKTWLIATISSEKEDIDDTLSTLQFAERARKIRTHFQHNVQNENPVVTILRELADLYVELNRQRIEIRRLLAPAGGGDTAKSRIATLRGLSLSADYDFFGGGPCYVQGRDVRTIPTHELYVLGDEVEAKLSESRVALKEVLQPLLREAKQLSGVGQLQQQQHPHHSMLLALGCTLHQLGVQRVDVLKEILPDEPLLTGRGGDNDQTSAPTNQQKEDIPNSLPSEVPLITPVVLTFDEEDPFLSDDVGMREGEDETQYRLRLKRQKEEKLWDLMLHHAGETSDLISCEAARSDYISREPPRTLRRHRTVHVCKLWYTTSDMEFIDTNYGDRSVEFIYRRYNSVAKACLVAEDGDIVEVHEGLWLESVAFVRNIDLVGVGNRDKIILRSPNAHEPTLMMNTAQGSVKKLSLRHPGGGDCCVHIRGGCGVLSDCSISAVKSRAGLRVSGGNTNPHVHDNYIHDCTMKTAGILIEQGARGVFEKNVVTRCGSAGIVIEGSATHPLVRNNRLVSGQGAGLAVGLRGRGIVEGNVIEHNACAGVLLESKANPTIRRNVIRLNLGGGVIIAHEMTFGLIEQNEISDNSERDVLVQYGALPQITRNTFVGGTRLGVSAPIGVVISTQSSCVLLENHFKQYEAYCVGCTNDDTWAYLIQNTFVLDRATSSGVSLFDRGNAQLRYNVFRSEKAGSHRADKWVVNLSGSTLVVRGNRVNEQEDVSPTKIPTAAPADDVFMVPYKFEMEVVKAQAKYSLTLDAVEK